MTSQLHSNASYSRMYSCTFDTTAATALHASPLMILSIIHGGPYLCDLHVRRLLEHCAPELQLYKNVLRQNEKIWGTAASGARKDYTTQINTITIITSVSLITPSAPEGFVWGLDVRRGRCPEGVTNPNHFGRCCAPNLERKMVWLRRAQTKTFKN